MQNRFYSVNYVSENQHIHLLKYWVIVDNLNRIKKMLFSGSKFIHYEQKTNIAIVHSCVLQDVVFFLLRITTPADSR